MRNGTRLVSIALTLAACAGDAARPDPSETDDAKDDDAAETDADATRDVPIETLDPGPAPRVVGVRARIEGVWVDDARVAARATADGLVVGVTAGPAIALEAVEVDLVVTLPGAHAWLSNGFQSWSQSGALALPSSPPTADALAAALAARGDVEVIRDGRALSWWHTWVATPHAEGPVLVVGALAGDRLAPSISAWRDGDDVRLVLRSGGQGDALAIAADATLDIESWHLVTASGRGALAAALAAFGDRLPTRRRAVAPPAEAGWNSWYELWSDVDEEAVRANAARLRATLGDGVPVDAPPLRVVIDDGWQRAWGDWQPNDKFPSGLDGLAADLAAEGLRVGVWLAPLLVHADSALAADHPDWLVADLTFDHLVEGPMRVLDPFHPDAAEHLRATAARLVGWGIDLLKIDFLFAGTWPGARAADKTGIEAYVRALALLREGAGEGALLLAVGNPATPALPYVDVWRVGGDIAVEPFGPSFPFVVNALRSIAARWPLCRATLCDADPALLRALPPDEVAFGIWVAALTGGGVFLSDDLRALDPDRAALLGPTALGVGLSGRVAAPLDLVPASPPDELRSALADHLADTRTQLVPKRWRLPSERVVVFDPVGGTVARERWPARAGLTWQIQLEGALARDAAVAAWDVDLFDTTRPEIAALGRAGAAVICYFSAGSWEDWRPDRDAFPIAARGATLAGFDDERWLDIRRADVRAALAARLDHARDHGCDAVDPDNVEGHLAETGFALTAADQLDFNRWLAAEAHARGLAIGLKNDLAQVAQLADDFDFAVNESCLVWDECHLLRPFLDRDKAVLHIEYADEGQDAASVCADPGRAGFSTIIKRSTTEVDAWRQACAP